MTRRQRVTVCWLLGLFIVVKVADLLWAVLS